MRRLLWSALLGAGLAGAALAAAASGTRQEASPTPAAGEELRDFVPSEDIPPGSAVSFPVDI